MIFFTAKRQMATHGIHLVAQNSPLAHAVCNMKGDDPYFRKKSGDFDVPLNLCNKNVRDQKYIK